MTLALPATEKFVAGGGHPASAPDSGLRARLEKASAVLSSVVAELDPSCLTVKDATDLYAVFAGLERLSSAGKTLLAPRIDESGIWRDSGHSTAATMLASLEGVSTGQARNTLEVGHRLHQLPGTEAAVRNGALSAPKVAELTRAAALDPTRETELLNGAAGQPLHEVKDRCQRARATSSREDPLAAVRRIRAARHFSSWTDPEGAFCYQGRDTADRGAQILSHLGYSAAHLRRLGTSAGKTGADGQVNEPERALRADAFFALITQQPPGADPVLGPGSGGAGTESADADSAGRPLADIDLDIDLDVDLDIDPEVEPEPPCQPAGPEGPKAPPSVYSQRLIDRPPTCSVMVRVDLAALLRGHALPGECCEIDNQGPIPVRMARDMANDSFLRFIFHEAGDVKAISHFGRTINRHLRTALVHRDRTCVVPGCGVSFGLEIDHVIPFAEHGPTELDNLALLCHHHHFLKTFEGWTLTRAGSGGTDMPEWRFEPEPPFGQEPGLGIDEPNGRSHSSTSTGTESNR
jgi:hypothetical protein